VHLDTENDKLFVLGDLFNRCPDYYGVFRYVPSKTILKQINFFIGGISFLMFLGISILLSKWAVKPVDLAWKQQISLWRMPPHELKTSLTIIITNAELAQSPEYDDDNNQRFINKFRSSCTGMTEPMI